MKSIDFNGMRFTQWGDGYYRCSVVVNGKRKMYLLHRYVWEYHNGEIPKGYDIHHINGDKDNNDISNLEVIQRCEHLKQHWASKSDDEIQKYRENMKEAALPQAIKWHGSEQGKEWHKEHYQQMKERLHQRKEFECKNCGKKYFATRSGFCCNACKSAYRRKTGVDNINVICEYCGKEFVTSKYSKARFCSATCTNKAVRWKKEV